MTASRFPYLRLPSERHLWKSDTPNVSKILKARDTGEPLSPISPGVAYRLDELDRITVCEDCHDVQFSKIGGYYIRPVGPFSLKVCPQCVDDEKLWQWIVIPTEQQETGSRSKSIRLKPLDLDATSLERDYDSRCSHSTESKRSSSSYASRSYGQSRYADYSVSTSHNTPVNED